MPSCHVSHSLKIIGTQITVPFFIVRKHQRQSSVFSLPPLKELSDESQTKWTDVEQVWSMNAEEVGVSTSKGGNWLQNEQIEHEEQGAVSSSWTETFGVSRRGSVTQPTEDEILSRMNSFSLQHKGEAK